MPTNICNVCKNEIEKSYTFRLKCIEADETLKCRLREIKVETNEADIQCSLIHEVTVEKTYYDDDFIQPADEECDRLDFKLDDDCIPQNTTEKRQTRSDSIKMNKSKCKKAKSKLKLTSKNSEMESIVIVPNFSPERIFCNGENFPDDLCPDSTVFEENFQISIGKGDVDNWSSSKLRSNSLVSDEFSTHLSNIENTEDLIDKRDLKSQNKIENTEEENSKSSRSSFSAQCSIEPKTKIHSKKNKFKKPYNNGMKRKKGFQKGHFQCSQCPKSFRNQERLNSHLKFHERPKFKCNICDKELLTSGSLTFHMIKHTDKNAYKCDVCEKEILGKYHFDVHKRTHYATNTFKCEICSKIMTTPDTFEVSFF